MPFSVKQIALANVAVAALLSCGSAHAADNAAAGAPAATTVVDANHRETNLRTTATTIVVLSLDDGKLGSKHR